MNKGVPVSPVGVTYVLDDYIHYRLKTPKKQVKIFYCPKLVSETKVLHDP